MKGEPPEGCQVGCGAERVRGQRQLQAFGLSFGRNEAEGAGLKGGAGDACVRAKERCRAGNPETQVGVREGSWRPKSGSLGV